MSQPTREVKTNHLGWKYFEVPIHGSQRGMSFCLPGQILINAAGDDVSHHVKDTALAIDAPLPAKVADIMTGENLYLYRGEYWHEGGADYAEPDVVHQICYRATEIPDGACSLIRRRFIEADEGAEEKWKLIWQMRLYPGDNHFELGEVIGTTLEQAVATAKQRLIDIGYTLEQPPT